MRTRDTDRIRDDAIRVGIRKAATGCLSCAEGYFNLARENGATEQQIASAIEGASPGLGLLTRRQLLRLAAGGIGALALSGVPLSRGSAEATCTPTQYTGSAWWGTHDSTHWLVNGSPYPKPISSHPVQDLYIYPAGDDVTQGYRTFDQTAATNAGYFGTYLYWNLWGPGTNLNESSAYYLGQQQADAAHNAWLCGKYAAQTGGGTIFGTVIPTAGWPNPCTALNGWAPDCEPLYNGGSTSPWAQANQYTIQGFLDEIAYWGLTPGLYTSPADWDKAFGIGYVPTQEFVLWLTPACWSCCGTCAGRNKYLIPCFPCDFNCDQTECQVRVAMYDVWRSSTDVAACGGQQAVIWHFWGNCPCAEPSGLKCSGDYDVCVQDPASGFTPAAYTGRPPSWCGYPPGQGENCCSGGCNDQTNFTNLCG